MLHIEQTIKDEGLPINSKAMMARLRELLEEAGTNCLTNIRNDPRVKAVMWLLMSQVFGQLRTIDMEQLWVELQEELPAE